MDPINPKEKNLLVIKIVGALLFSIFACIGVFFSIWRDNWNTACWCVLLEITCVALLVFNKMYVRSQLRQKCSASFFRVSKNVLNAVTAGSFISCVAYIVVGAVGKETFDVRSHYASAPVAFLTGFWSLVLYFDFRKFEALVE